MARRGLCFIAVAGVLWGLLPSGVARAEKCPNMLILLDRSYSMEGQKWAAALAAIESLIDDRQGLMRFGLVLFPWEDEADPECGGAGWIVDCGFYTGAEIMRGLSYGDPGGQTPTARALAVAGASEAMRDVSRRRYIILLTDGDPTCPDGGDIDGNVDAAVAELEALRVEGVSTFVIGFGEEASPARLNRLAAAGGMARQEARCGASGETACSYFEANDRESLLQAFNEIVAVAQGELSGRNCDDSCYVIDGCPAGERCVANLVSFQEGRFQMNLGACAPDPCAGVSCGEASFCREGACLPACLSPCAVGEICRDGACTPVGEDGQTCADPCLRSLVCLDGACVDDPCRYVACPDVAPYCYRGSCYATREGKPGTSSETSASEEASSGCGCAASVGAETAGFLWALCVPLLRRRCRAP